MNKKTIFLASILVILVGIIIIKEFLSSTTISKEKAIQILTPASKASLAQPKPDTSKVIVSGAVTFLLSEKNIIYYYKGAFNGILNKTDFSKVGQLIKKYNTEIEQKDLIFLIKQDTAASLKNTVDLLDQMTLNNIAAGKYAMGVLNNSEIESIKKLKETK